MHAKLSTNLKFFNACVNYGDLWRARQLLDNIPDPDLRSWTVLISAYTKWGRPREAIQVYDELRSRNVDPDQLALLSVAKACASARDLRKAKEIHEDVIRLGFQSELVVGNALIDMFGKCKYSEGARKVFDDLRVKDVISWTSMCSCYVKCRLPREAIQVFSGMVLGGVRPNSVTLSSVLPACSDLKNLRLGREIHGHVIRKGMEDNVFVSSALVDMYASCSSIKKAELVFLNMPSPRRDVVLWNVVLSAYFSHGECEKALSMFDHMRNELVKLNHDSWNAVIGGCAQSGRTEQALALLAEMQHSGTKPNLITINSVLPACTHLESLRAGKEIHGFVFRHGFSMDITVATALLFLYAKCGASELSSRVFNLIPTKDTVAWNTMIFANSMHGNGEEALFLFNEMLSSGLEPNAMTFTAVLSGCSHSQLVDEGLMIFHSMTKDHGVEPEAEHYSCVVDVLSRAGCLEEAYRFIQEMPIEPSASAWGALLAACKVYNNVDLGRIAANQLFEVEPQNPGNYVMLSNIFEASKLREEASKTRELMRARGITKLPGCSWLQVKNKTYSFVAGDKSNAQSDEIYKFLDEICEEMRVAGQLPNTDFVLQDLDTEEKEYSLCNHSEKLAVAFGILNLNGASTLTVFKNLRICGDCHNVIKFIAKTVGVRIIVRDCSRFHHFKDGLCSCKDFW